MTLTTYLTAGGAVLALALAATFLLPAQVHVERSATIAADPAQVIALAASNTGYQHFNPYLTSDPDLKISHFGPASGVGSGFHFDGREGRGSQTVVSVTDTQVVYQIDLGALGRPVQTITVRPVAEGTHVTWSMDSDMGMNPVFRVFGLFMDGMIGKTFTQGLDNLARAAA